MGFPRASGILLHISSLPSRFGIGDFGPSAYSFVDFLKSAGQKYWQILPIGPPGYGNSPYNCLSAFAGNTAFISPELLAAEGLLPGPARTPRLSAKGGIEAASALKAEILGLAFANFKLSAFAGLKAEFETFCHENSFWLEDYALFRVLKRRHNESAWTQWDAPLRFRDEKETQSARASNAEAIDAERFFQFIFFSQWAKLRRYAHENDIRIIGDVPLYIAHDSADVWASPRNFKLNDDGTPRVVAGVPPDYFSTTGQRWGNPIYDWDRMRSDGFGWWITRLHFNLKLFDAVRIDHFIGFTRAWEVPATDETAENGTWASVPGRELFSAAQNSLGDLRFIAEDLGDVTPDVEALRDDFGLPGMRVLQFAFGGDARNIHLPHNHRKNTVVYTGTHDNETVAGWRVTRKKSGGAADLKHCLKYLGSDGRQLHRDFIRAAYSSVADLAIVPMQDVLGLDNRARMNLPGTIGGNWEWRCGPDDFSPKTALGLRELSELFGR